MVTIPVTQLSESGEAAVVLASYGKDGQFRSMTYLKTGPVPVGETVKLTFSVEDVDSRLVRLKAFPVASIENLTPLGEVSVFSN